MIIEIDGHFFNPLLVTQLIEVMDSKGKLIEIRVFFDNNNYLSFENWTCYNLAARINELIEEFNKK